MVKNSLGCKGGIRMLKAVIPRIGVRMMSAIVGMSALDVHAILPTRMPAASLISRAQSYGTWNEAFAGGRYRRSETGSCQLEIGGKSLEIEVRWIDPRWGTTVVDGAMCASRTNDSICLSFSATADKRADLNKDHPLMILVSGDASTYSTGRMLFGQDAKTFETSCWSWGNSIVLQPMHVKIDLSASLSMNYLIEENGKWQMRLFFVPTRMANGMRLFEGSLMFSRGDTTIALASDILEQKRIQYGRVLMPPQEKGLDTSRWRMAITASNATQKTFELVENLFDTRSRLYSAAERLKCRPTVDVQSDRMVASGYAALNAMDLVAATNVCARLESRLADDRMWMPYGTFNPFNWVKCFTQWGYMRASDGCGIYEPNPWLLQWEDGFRFSLAQDRRVVIARNNDEDRFCETRYLKPMADVSFERSWVSTVWNLPDYRVTFSVLTPIVDVEGTDALTLSGFSSEPRTLRWLNGHGQVELVRLQEGGERKVNATRAISPYLRLEGHNWELALFPTAKPISVNYKDGVLTIRFDREGDVGVLRLRNNIHASEQTAICEFFARTYLAYPTSCRTMVKDGLAYWQYAYNQRTNLWNTLPHKVAPVPPLLSFAGLHVAGERRVKYPTKWGLYSSVDGDTVTCRLPTDLPREPRLRGVNVSIVENDKVWAAHVKNGAQWVRAYFDGTVPVERQFFILEEKLKKFGSRVKFLVDLHGCECQVSWGGGVNSAFAEKLCTVWDRISKICARYPQAIEGYDLYNEPGLTEGSEVRWKTLNERIATVVRRNHSNAKVYFSAINGGNPNGLLNLVPLDSSCEPQAITYHFYSPHAFSHQKCATQNKGGDTCVFYPAWSAPIDWAAGNHFGGTTVDWYDRWTLAAILLPADEHYAQYRKPMHVGELGVIGYANDRSPNGAWLWTRDVVELLEAKGASWHIWNGGFGLANRLTRQYIYGLWRNKD